MKRKEKKRHKTEMKEKQEYDNLGRWLVFVIEQIRTNRILAYFV